MCIATNSQTVRDRTPLHSELYSNRLRTHFVESEVALIIVFCVMHFVHMKPPIHFIMQHHSHREFVYRWAGWRGTIESCVRAIRNFRRLQMKSCKWSKLWPTVLKETQSQPVSAPWVVILRFWTAWPMPHENLVQTGLLESMRAFPRILKTRSILGKTQGASETRTTRQAQQKLNFPFLGHGSISEFHYVHELIVSIFWKVWNYVYACQPTFWNPTCAGQ